MLGFLIFLPVMHEMILKGGDLLSIPKGVASSHDGLHS